MRKLWFMVGIRVGMFNIQVGAPYSKYLPTLLIYDIVHQVIPDSCTEINEILLLSGFQNSLKSEHAT